MIGNKIADRITKETETNEEEILRERFMPPELRHKITDDLSLKTENNR